jgi:hypothetical protein
MIPAISDLSGTALFCKKGGFSGCEKRGRRGEISRNRDPAVFWRADPGAGARDDRFLTVEKHIAEMKVFGGVLRRSSPS